MTCNFFIKKVLPILIGFFTFTFIACDSGNNNKLVSEIPLVYNILEDQSSIHYANYPDYNKDLKSLPIGMFDSGTGGLTVMEQFLAMDNFNNERGEEEPDGIPDFYGNISSIWQIRLICHMVYTHLRIKMIIYAN